MTKFKVKIVAVSEISNCEGKMLNSIVNSEKIFMVNISNKAII